MYNEQRVRRERDEVDECPCKASLHVSSDHRPRPRVPIRASAVRDGRAPPRGVDRARTRERRRGRPRAERGNEAVLPAAFVDAVRRSVVLVRVKHLPTCTLGRPARFFDKPLFFLELGLREVVRVVIVIVVVVVVIIVIAAIAALIIRCSSHVTRLSAWDYTQRPSQIGRVTHRHHRRRTCHPPTSSSFASRRRHCHPPRRRAQGLPRLH